MRRISFHFISLAVALLPLSSVHADPVFYYPEPNPPTLEIAPGEIAQRTPRARTPRVATQEWLYHKTSDGQHPDGNEQAMLWLTNIARANPPAEGIWLATSSDPDIAQGRTYFSVDTAMLRSEFDSYTPTPPAAFDVRLYRAAYNHSLDLIARDAQDHTGQFDRVTAQNFSYSSLGGNVFSYAGNALNAHAGFNIDWGTGPGNMQTGRGHRVSKMSINKDFANAGIAIVPETNSATRVGPYVVTENYGTAASWISDGTHYNRFLVGTVWEDKNNNARYDDGEGFGNVRVQPEQGTYYAVTGNAGGYALPLTVEGTYQVTLSGGPFTQAVTKQIQVGAQSLLLDYQFQGGTGTTTYALTVSKTGSGTVTGSPSGINCGTVCSSAYTGGDLVTLTAEAASGYSFSGWSGDCVGTQTTCSVTMSSARNVSAVFSPITDTALNSGVAVSASLNQGAWQYYRISSTALQTRLTVELSGLSADLDLYVRKGAQPTSTAFDCRPLSGGTSVETCVLDNTAATTWYIGVTGNTGGTFTLKATLSTNTANYPLTVVTSGSGGITSTPAGIDCGSVCSYTYAGGTPVSLTATPANGYSFSAWSGACSGTQTACTVTVNSALNVSATFIQLPNNSLGSGVAVNGSVTLSGWQYYRISADATHTNLTVELSGLSADLDLYVRNGTQPASDAYDCRPYLSGTSTEICTLDNTGIATWYIAVNGYEAGNFTLKATLSSAATYSLSVAKTGSGGVSSSPSGIDCGSVCDHSYANGTLVTLQATPAGGNVFSGWGGACSGTQTACTVTMNATRSVSAIFTDPGTPALSSGVALNGALAMGEWRDYTIVSSASHTQLAVDLYNLSGDVDLYVQQGAPIVSSADCVADALGTQAENCTLTNTGAVTWYISIYAYDSSNYSLKATLSGGVIVTARLTNISTRANVSGGQNDAFAGFVLSGTGTQQIMLRGIAAAGGVNPALLLLKRNGTAWDSLDSNDEWENHANAAAVGALASNLRLPDTYGNDAGALLNLGAGVYSAQLSSYGSAGLEVVGVDAVSDTGPVLTNISTRAYVSGGSNDAFAGFVISGSGTLKVMLRGIAAASGVNPSLTLLKRNGTAWEPVATNDEWEWDANAAAVSALASNLRLPDTYGNDAGMLLDLAAGVYSVQLSSTSGPGLAVVGVDAVQ